MFISTNRCQILTGYFAHQNILIGLAKTVLITSDFRADNKIAKPRIRPVAKIRNAPSTNAEAEETLVSSRDFNENLFDSWRLFSTFHHPVMKSVVGQQYQALVLWTDWRMKMPKSILTSPSLTQPLKSRSLELPFDHVIPSVLTDVRSVFGYMDVAKSLWIVRLSQFVATLKTTKVVISFSLVTNSFHPR